MAGRCASVYPGDLRCAHHHAHRQGESRTGCVASAWAWTIMWLKPFSFAELVAPSRRSSPAAGAAPPETHPALIVRGDIVIDLAERRVMRRSASPPHPHRVSPARRAGRAAGLRAQQGSPDKGLGERVRRRRRKCKALHLLPASET